MEIGKSLDLDDMAMTGSAQKFPEKMEKLNGETSNGTGIQCKICPKLFTNHYFQRKHMQKTHEEGQICQFTSKDVEKMRNHTISHHISKKKKGDGGVQEIIQGEIDKSIDIAPNKLMMEDGVSFGKDANSKTRFVCELCSYVYMSKYLLDHHVCCHTLKKPYQCDVCDFSSKNREYMIRHMTSVHLIIKHELNSSSFDRSSTSLLDSSSGKKRKFLNDAFECAVCGMRATYKTDLMDHIRTKHPNAHIESLVNNDGSKVHLIIADAKKIKTSKKLSLQCNYCSLTFPDTWKFKVHLRSHTGVKPFQCSICDTRATSKMTIRDHIHRKHTEADNAKIILHTVGTNGNAEEVHMPVPWHDFKCEICDEKCTDKYSLKLHKNKEHPDAQPFSCTECGQKEKVKANMIIHCTDAHPDRNMDDIILRNGKPIKVGNVKLPTCDFCSKIFGFNSQLNIHMRSHM